MFLTGTTVLARPALDAGWDNPPTEARLRAYWWWLNGNVTKSSITSDLEQMKAKGFGGAVIFDANGAAQDGNETVPHGPTFFSPEWRELYRHALREAHRLDLEMSLNIQSGWNLGGPVVTKENAAKKFVWSETNITGGHRIDIKLPSPSHREKFYRDIAVLAYPLKSSNTVPLKNWKQKALQESLRPFSTPDSSPLFAETPGISVPDTMAVDVLNLTHNVSPDGCFRWEVPPGQWQILRFGYTIDDHAYVSTCSEGWNGFALDVYSATAFQNYWDAVVAPLIDDAGPLAGTALKYLHTDSWEIELANWTPKLPDEFKKRRRYDLVPWLPVLAGRIVNSRKESDRFLFDYRKTLGDLTIDGHYRLFRDNAHKRGLDIHPESGGPHAVPIDAQRCLGWDDAPMSEFWAWSWTHRIGDANRFFVKQPASAAHTYGHKLVMAEGFTTIGPHWQEKIWDNLKPSFDKALCEGLNVLVWHAFVCSPEETGIPGQQYFAGTHLNPKVTWWDKSAPFFHYINRCQWMLQQGQFFADVLYYYGDHVPNFAQLKRADPARVQSGYDYDVITEEALIERATVKDGCITLPDGMNYRVLVLPERGQISLAVLKKLKELVHLGATVIGPKPTQGETQENDVSTDAQIKKLADELWEQKDAGRLITGKTAREVLLADGVLPDCEFVGGGNVPVPLDYIHRTDGDTEIYYIANSVNIAVKAQVVFRVVGKAPEIWDPVTAEQKFAAAYEEKGGRTFVPLYFPPCGSLFVVFRKPAANHLSTSDTNSVGMRTLQQLEGAWTVHFDIRWGGPETIRFETLNSWTDHPEPGIRFYSGTAVYEKNFDLGISQINGNDRIFLDLGSLRELAEVKVNGKTCGTVWCPPWSVDVGAALHPGENKLQIEVVNFWPNRLIGDANPSERHHFTRTNIRKFKDTTPLEPAGLFGPVKLEMQTAPESRY